MHADNPKKNFAIFSLVDVLDIDIKILTPKRCKSIILENESYG